MSADYPADATPWQAAVADLSEESSPERPRAPKEHRSPPSTRRPAVKLIPPLPSPSTTPRSQHATLHHHARSSSHALTLPLLAKLSSFASFASFASSHTHTLLVRLHTTFPTQRRPSGGGTSPSRSGASTPPSACWWCEQGRETVQRDRRTRAGTFSQPSPSACGRWVGCGRDGREWASSRRVGGSAWDLLRLRGTAAHLVRGGGSGETAAVSDKFPPSWWECVGLAETA